MCRDPFPPRAPFATIRGFSPQGRTRRGGRRTGEKNVQDLIGQLGAPLLGSIIGAAATIVAALVNLRIAWKKEMSARTG